MTEFSQLRVFSYDEKLHLSARFDEGTIEVTGGGAGWEAVQRPQKRALTAWRGPTEAYGFTIPLIFDGFARGDSVASDVRTLEKMAGINVPGDPKPPPLVLDAGGTLPHDFINAPQNLWIIPETPTWGERNLDRHGTLIRQHVTVKFALYTVDTSLTRENKVNTTYVKARAGDTWEKIAARKLAPWGGKRWAGHLAHLNGARDAAAKIKTGTPVLIPTPALIEQWRRKPRR